MRVSITEALAEIKTINARLEKKKQFVMQYTLRQEMVKDPLEKQGGSAKLIEETFQSIHDLEDRVIKIRAAIQASNLVEPLTIDNQMMSVAMWLTWRKEIADQHRSFISSILANVNKQREDLRKRGITVGQVGVNLQPTDVVVHVDELKLSKELEEYTQVLGKLDGRLSLHNSRTEVEIE